MGIGAGLVATLIYLYKRKEGVLLALGSKGEIKN